MKLAPIALFAYNRPEHTEKTLLSLADNVLFDRSRVFIFSDGPKNAEDYKKVLQVRSLLKRMAQLGDIRIIESEKNVGLAGSIIGGITKVLSEYDRIIVVEDDLMFSRYFLKYMNDALEIYASDDKVMHVSGYMFPIKTSDLGSTFFYNQASSWGWGTWSRAWRYFNPDPWDLYEEIRSRNLLKRYDFDSSAEYLWHLKKNIDGKINTWAIKWHTSIFLRDGLCLYPSKSLVENMGHDGTGSHCQESGIYDVNLSEKPISVEKIALAENNIARERMKVWHLLNKPIFIRRIKRRICNYFIRFSVRKNFI